MLHSCGKTGCFMSHKMEDLKEMLTAVKVRLKFRNVYTAVGFNTQRLKAECEIDKWKLDER